MAALAITVCCCCLPCGWLTVHPCACLGLLLQDPSRAATVDNLVLLTHAEADEHEQLQSLEELRRRAGQMRRPQEEREYIDRLLKSF